MRNCEGLKTMSAIPTKTIERRRLETGPIAISGDGAEQEFSHWRLTRDEEDVAWLALDKQNTSTNVLSPDILEELFQIVEKLEANPPKGLVIRSAKPAGFCAGFDINEFNEFDDVESIVEQLTRGHAVLDRLEALKAPTVAVVHGKCLGGGFELALTCDYRIAVDGASFGFPEIMLGLHPGLGGTFRLTQLIDPVEAMTLMLTGKEAHTKKARKLCIADTVVEERYVRAAARAAIAGDIEQADRGFREKALNTLVARNLVAVKMRQTSEKKAAPEHYPAPYALIELWEKHGGDPKEMQREEMKSFADLMLTDTAQNLIRVFFLRQTLKGPAEEGRRFEHVHVIGAGSMGGAIAAWCALRGLRVTVSDVELGSLAEAVKGAVKLCEDKHRNQLETRDTLDRLIPDVDDAGVAKADLVIEAVPEKKDLKQKIYRDIEPRMKKAAILATNTSSIPLDDLAESLERPEQFVGLHFFNPVAQMMVVEVIHHPKTAEDVEKAAVTFTDSIGKLPAPVASSPGFLVNRALTPYLLEAMVMVDEGLTPASVDAAAEQFGFPTGPIELADYVGLDICADVVAMMQESLEKPLADIPQWVRDIVENGNLGKKTGKGLYPWKNGKAVKADHGSNLDDAATDRLILPILDACVECYRKGVAGDLDVIDGAMIFATGFAPFRGGPIHYAKNRGVDNVVETLGRLAQEHGPRFEPDSGWAQLK